MPYYHAKITYGLYGDHDYELDLTEEEIMVIAEQYENGEHVLFNGKWIKVNDLKEIEIRETPEKTTYFFPSLSFSSIFGALDSQMSQEDS